MITEADLIRICSDPRFERTVLAILRRKLRAPEEEDETPASSSTTLDREWGWITIQHAATKYALDIADIIDAIAKKHVFGNDSKVDEDSLRRWKFGDREQNLPPLETTVPGGTSELVSRDSMTPREAATYLNMQVGSIYTMLSKNVLNRHPNGGCTTESVYRYSSNRLDKTKEILQEPKRRGDKRSALPDEEKMSCAAAAELLGVNKQYVSVLKCQGVLSDAGHGFVGSLSVENYKQRRREKKPIAVEP